MYQLWVILCYDKKKKKMFLSNWEVGWFKWEVFNVYFLSSLVHIFSSNLVSFEHNFLLQIIKKHTLFTKSQHFRSPMGNLWQICVQSGHLNLILSQFLWVLHDPFHLYKLTFWILGSLFNSNKVSLKIGLWCLFSNSPCHFLEA